MQKNTKIAVFKGKKVRRAIHNDEWWFSVVDVCAVLTDSVDSGAYWRKLKQRLKDEGNKVVTFCHGLKLKASDGKKYETEIGDGGRKTGYGNNRDIPQYFRNSVDLSNA